MKWRRRRPPDPDPATSLDCLDGQHQACVPNSPMPGSVAVCACTCHRFGDPATVAAQIAGTLQDPRNTRRGRWT